jgi:CBS domain-containing protein
MTTTAHGRRTPHAALRPRRLRVADVMSRDVVTVSPTATVREIAGLMRRHAVSALPVVADGGALRGIVSEADLLIKEDPPSPRRGWLPERAEVAQRRRRAAGVSAAEVMSAPAASIEPEATLGAAARCLGTRRVRRLVVVDADEHVVGIVSRRDLLAAFTRPDDEIRRDIVEGVLPRWLTTIDPAEVTVGVHDGMVRIEGTVDRRSDAEMLTHLVSGLDGVVDLDNSVDYRWND